MVNRQQWLLFFSASWLSQSAVISWVTCTTDMIGCPVTCLYTSLPSRIQGVQKNEMNRALGHFCAHIGYMGQENLLRMVRWMWWHCPPDTGFKIRALAVWGRVRYFSVTEAPHNTDFHTWMGKKHFCFFETAETGNRTPNSAVLTTTLGPPPSRRPSQGLDMRSSTTTRLWDLKYR